MKTKTTIKNMKSIMDIVDNYGNAEHHQNDGQALYFRGLIEAKIVALTTERDALRVTGKLALGALESLHKHASEEFAATPKLVNTCRTAGMQIITIKQAEVL